jgi:hypothetical protein
MSVLLVSLLCALSNAAAPDPTIRMTVLPSLQLAGPVETVFNVVFVSSGYTNDQAPLFQLHTTMLVRSLTAAPAPHELTRTSPIMRFNRFMNIFGVFVPSQDSGTSDSATLERRDTSLYCTYTAAAPFEFRGRITCDREAAVGYASVSPVNAVKYSANTIVIALVYSPYTGADHQGNVIYLSAAYLQRNLVNTTRQILLHKMNEIWFGLGEEFSYGDVLATSGQEGQLKEVPNCFDPRSPTGIPWSVAVFEQKLSPFLASLSWEAPYDAELRLDDVPGPPCSFDDALRPSSHCIMQQSRSATTDETRDPALIPAAQRGQVIFEGVVTRSSSSSSSLVQQDWEDAHPHFCYVCMEHAAVAYLSSIAARGAGARIPSGIGTMALMQLPRCPLPTEIYFATVSEDIHLHTNKFALPTNGFATVWLLLNDDGTTQQVLDENVTTLVYPAVRIIEQTKRSVATIRLITRDLWIDHMMGPSAGKAAFGDDWKTRLGSSSTDFTIQISANPSDLVGWRYRVCDNSLFDLSANTETAGASHRYRSFCSEQDEASCSYNYTNGALTDIVTGFRISAPIAVLLFASLAVLGGPWILLAVRYAKRIRHHKDPKVAYMRVPLRRSIVVIRWVVFSTAAVLCITSTSLWGTGFKTYVATQTITSVVLGFVVGAAIIINTFAILPAYGAILRSWIPLLLASFLVLGASIALLVTAQMLINLNADPQSQDSIVSVTLKRGWRSLVRSSPSAACSFEQQMSCSGWSTSCIRTADSLDCPPACSANIEKRTPCAIIVQALIASRLESVITVTRGAAGVLLFGAVCYSVMGKLVYDLRREVAEAAMDPELKEARERRRNRKAEARAAQRAAQKRRQQRRRDERSEGIGGDTSDSDPNSPKPLNSSLAATRLAFPIVTQRLAQRRDGTRPDRERSDDEDNHPGSSDDEAPVLPHQSEPFGASGTFHALMTLTARSNEPVESPRRAASPMSSGWGSPNASAVLIMPQHQRDDTAMDFDGFWNTSALRGLAPAETASPSAADLQHSVRRRHVIDSSFRRSRDGERPRSSMQFDLDAL